MYLSYVVTLCVYCTNCAHGRGSEVSIGVSQTPHGKKLKHERACHSSAELHLFILRRRRDGEEACHLIGPAAQHAFLCLHIHLQGRVESSVHPFLPEETQRLELFGPFDAISACSRG